MTLNTGASAVALLLVLGLTPPALAQTTAPSQQAPKATEAPKAPVTGQIVTQEDNTILAKDLIGQTVYAPDKTKIGSISDLILSKDGKTVQGFVIGVGGFLGIGEVRQHAQEMDPSVAKAHIELYVNAFTANLGEDGYAAVENLLGRAMNEGLVPSFDLAKLR